MSNIRDCLSRRELRIRSTPLLAKAAVCAAILVCAVTLIALHITLRDTRQAMTELSRQASALEQ